jgi:hypothetical protein
MGKFNHLASQKRAHNHINRWGGIGQLVRGGVGRNATMAILEFSPRERNLVEEGVERIRVSAKGLTVPPDTDLDQVVFKGRKYNIQEPPLGPRPNGIAIFHDLYVIYTGPA